MKKKHLIFLAGFVVLAVVLFAVWQLNRPAADVGSKTIEVEVVHSDGSVANFTYRTDEEYLGGVLTEAELISGSESDYGLYVETVDNETADYNVDGSWWKLSCNGEDSQTGVDNVAIHDGDQFTWTYTK